MICICKHVKNGTKSNLKEIQKMKSINSNLMLLWLSMVFHLFVKNREKCVVFKKANDIVFFITGSGEYTELVCLCFVLSLIHSK